MTIHKAIICAVSCSFFLGCVSHHVVALKVSNIHGTPLSNALVMQVERTIFCRYTPFFRGRFMAWRNHTPYDVWIETNRFEYHYHPYVLVGVTDANGIVRLPLHQRTTINFEFMLPAQQLYARSNPFWIGPFGILPNFQLETEPLESKTLETMLEYLEWADSSALKIPFANPETSTTTESFRRKIHEMAGMLSSVTNRTSIDTANQNAMDRTSHLDVAVEYVE